MHSRKQFFSAWQAQATMSICALLLACTPLAAQIRFFESPRALPTDIAMGLLAPSPTRHIIHLNGSWSYATDDNQESGTVRVPSSFDGTERVVFTRGFDVDGSIAGRSVFQLVAISISYYCEIRINGQFIGKHAGDATFSLKVSPGIIHGGRNKIEITVVNALNAHETVPLKEQPWNPRRYGGIIHDIAIAANGAVWVQETAVRSVVTGEGKAATVTYQALLNSGPVSRLGGDSARLPINFGKSPVDHYVEIVDQQTGELIYRSEARRVVIESDRLTPVELSFTIPAVRLWSPETPYTYVLRQRTLSGSTLIDESSQTIGFRNFSAGANGFMLNGAPFFLKGVSWYEDSPLHGRSLSIDEIERDVLLIKNLGANAVRLPGGPVHPMFYSICDKYGLLVFQDLPLYQSPRELLITQALQTSARNLLREMLLRDQNHPCIVAYGAAQGVDGSAPGLDAYFEAVGRAMTDRAPHLFYASFFHLPSVVPAGLDFVGLDIPPTASATVKAKLESDAPSIDGKPVLISSLTYPVEIGNYSGYSDNRSIDAQAQFYLELYPVIQERKFAGVFADAFADRAVHTPIMIVDRVQQFTATTGIADAWRQKRLAYDVLKARFNNEKVPVLTIGNYVEDHPATFVVIGILLIFIFAVVYNLFRRFRENVVRSFLRPHNFFTDVRDQRMLSIFQTTVVGLIGSLSAALFHANLLYYWRMNYYVDVLIAQFIVPVWLKQWMNFTAWNPLANIAVLTVLLFLVLLLYSFVIRALAFFMRRNILLFDAYSVSMWSVLPMALLAPFGMVLYRIIALPVFEAAAVIAWIAFHVWIISRLLKGTAVVLDVRPLYFYIAGYALIIIGVGSWLWSLDAQNATFAFLHHTSSVWLHLRSFAP